MNSGGRCITRGHRLWPRRSRGASRFCPLRPRRAHWLVLDRSTLRDVFSDVERRCASRITRRRGMPHSRHGHSSEQLCTARTCRNV